MIAEKKSTTRRRTARPSREAATPNNTFLNDFNLTPTGAPSLTEYCAQKNPQTVDDKFLVASA